MIVETIEYKKIFAWGSAVWARSFAAVLMFFIGMLIGEVRTESRVIGDCKYAGAFRVEQQAFMCQRRI